VVDDLPAFLVQEVLPPVRDLGVDAASARGRLLRALNVCGHGFALAVEPRDFDLTLTRQRRQRFETEVYSDARDRRFGGALHLDRDVG
jgi:hypothetical protein